MTVKELKERLNNMSPSHDDEIVCVISDRNSMGGYVTVDVKSISSGFDWNRGLFMIRTIRPMIDVPIDINEMKVIDPEFVKIVNDNFFDLI